MIERARPMIERRSLLIGIGATLVCAPAIVRFSSLMPVKMMMIEPPPYHGFVDRLYFSCCAAALAGRSSPPIYNGRPRTVAEMQATVAYARRVGIRL
jgi:hypothetical protein